MEPTQSSEVLLNSFWFVAIPASLIFLIQAVMTFMGTDAHDGVQADFDGDLSGADAPFQLFSLRNLIHFLLGFSWTGIALYSVISNTVLLISISVLVGCLFVYMFFAILRQLKKLSEDNSFNISSALNKTAEVYLTIPERKKGKGKIMISIKGTYHELDAMTELESIPSGVTVKVVRLENNSILIVEKI